MHVTDADNYVEQGDPMKPIHKRGAAHRSLEKGTSSRRAHEQSTTAKPFLTINSRSCIETHCVPTGLKIKLRFQINPKVCTVKTQVR